MPDAPELSAPTACIGESNILNWTASAGATGYRLYDGDDNLLYTGALLTFTHTPIALGFTVSYYVIAFDGGGDSGPSNIVEATPCIDAPTLTAEEECEGEERTLFWTAEAGAAGYLLSFRYLNGMGNQGVWTLLYDGPLLTYAHTDLVLGTPYQYRVIPYAGAAGVYGEGSPSDVVTSTPCCIDFITLSPCSST